jgi:hypothetical protein
MGAHHALNMSNNNHWIEANDYIKLDGETRDEPEKPII